MFPSLNEQRKTQLRQHFLAARARVSLDHASTAGNAAATLFIKHIPVSDGAVIGLYYPIRHELNCLPLLESLVKQSHITALPYITGKEQPLLFRAWTTGDALIPGPFFGISEPTATAKAVIPDCLVVPLVAFSPHGDRLGYGGGFYDRTIAKLRHINPEVLVVGYAFTAQCCEELRGSSHDQRLDYVVTEEKVLSFG